MLMQSVGMTYILILQVIPTTSRFKRRVKSAHSKREETLKSLVFTLNKIWLEDHQAVVKSYPKLEEEDGMMPMAAEGKRK